MFYVQMKCLNNTKLFVSLEIRYNFNMNILEAWADTEGVHGTGTAVALKGTDRDRLFWSPHSVLPYNSISRPGLNLGPS